MDVLCGRSHMPQEALRTVVIATGLMVGVLTLTISSQDRTWRRFVST